MDEGEKKKVTALVQKNTVICKICSWSEIFKERLLKKKKTPTTLVYSLLIDSTQNRFHSQRLHCFFMMCRLTLSCYLAVSQVPADGGGALLYTEPQQCKHLRSEPRH